MTRRVLAIDDMKTLRDMVAATLRKAGFEVAEAADGQEGLAVFATFKPDVVITDLNMPVMDGLTFVRSCRARPDGRNVPILLLTTESSAEKKAEGRAAGATGWLVKPFNPDKLVAVISKVCQ